MDFLFFVYSVWFLFWLCWVFVVAGGLLYLWCSGLLHCRQILYHLSHQGSPLVNWLCWVFIVADGLLYLWCASLVSRQPVGS